MNFLGINYIDLIIVLILVYFASEALRHGLFVILADFLSFLGSLLISLRAYKFVAGILKDNISLSNSVANALGFLITAILIEAFLGIVLANLVSRLPKKWLKNSFSKTAAMFPALGEGIIIIAFILTLIMALPVNPQVKEDVSDSKLGGSIIAQTTGIEKKVNDIFGGVIEDSLTYLIVKPESTQTVPLNINRYNLQLDPQAEQEMFTLVNQERKKQGIQELVWDEKLAQVARAHGEDMWKRKYFGHFSPEGKSVGDRLNEAKIAYFVAGENLALAPTVNTAHTGLMNSEGHRRNILEKNFNKIGIGVVDNGVYGKMFVQVFTN